METCNKIYKFSYEGEFKNDKIEGYGVRKYYYSGDV